MSQSLLEQAVTHHRDGDEVRAESIYRQLIDSGGNQLAARHNLGIILLNRGQLDSGLSLIQGVYDENPDHPELTDTFSVVGNILFENNHWEAAQPWLALAAKVHPENQQVKQLLSRVAPRDYLQPEFYDPLAEQTLARYSPREADTYIYTIDISGTCNLRCPSCPVGNFQDAGRSSGFMPLTLFQSIIKKIKQEAVATAPQIWLYNWGEPLLHPNLFEIIASAKGAGFTVHISTNLNSEHGISKLAKAEPDEIKISLSGFTEDTYALTHTRGKLTLLKANMYLLRHYLTKYRSSTRVWVGHHLYKTNIDQVEQVAAFCNELGFEHHPIQAFFQPLEKLVKLAQGQRDIRDEPLMQQLLVDPSDYIANIKANRSGNYDCELRFNQTVINHDGSVALCCSTYEQSNMLGVQFLDEPHGEIQRRKYAHGFCQQCRQSGCDYSVTEVMNRSTTK